VDVSAPQTGLALPRRQAVGGWLIAVTFAAAAGAILLAGQIDLDAPVAPGAFLHLFARDEPSAAWLACGLILAAAIAARFFPRALPDRLLARLCEDPRWFVGLFTAALAAGALVAYRAHPLSMDEYAPYFQAGAFARFSLSGKVPPGLIDRLIPPGRWFLQGSPAGEVISVYWPGFALLLTPFFWLRCPWLLNPLLGAATLLALHRLARRCFPGTRAPGWTVLFAAASPAFSINAISYYSMTAHLLASTLFALLLLEPSPRRLALAGALGSFALVLHNPLPHTLFALPFIVWLALRPDRVRNLALLAAGYLPLLLLLGVGWLWVQTRIAPSSGEGMGSLFHYLAQLGFSAPSAAYLIPRAQNVVELIAWGVPGLVALAAVGAWRHRQMTPVRLLAAAAALTFAGYFFVPYDQGHGWGYRYFHSAWLVLPLFGAAALIPEREEEGFLRRLLLGAALGSLVLATGLRLAQVQSFIDGQLAQVPAPVNPDKQQVVFVHAERGYYTIDLIQNDPFMDGARWTLISHGDDDDDRFMKALPPSRLKAKNPVAAVWELR
jgi:hypothetical protein